MCNTSIIQKLQILEQFLKAWEENAAAFLAQPQIGNIEATVASTSESVNHIALLKEAMGLYLAMRVVRVQSSATNLKLRAVVWKLSTVPFQRVILATPFEATSSQNPAIDLIAAFSSNIRSKAVDERGLLCPTRVTDFLRESLHSNKVRTASIPALHDLRDILRGGIGLGIQSVTSSTMQRLMLLQQGTDLTLRESKVYLQRVTKEAKDTLYGGNGGGGEGQINNAVSQAIHLAHNAAASVLAPTPPPLTREPPRLEKACIAAGQAMWYSRR